MKKICKNCRLFDESKSECSVVILIEGEKIRLPVLAEDSCFFEQKFQDPETGEWSDFNEIKEVRFWMEDEKGNKSDKGKMKIQCPSDFFGTSIDQLI